MNLCFVSQNVHINAHYGRKKWLNKAVLVEICKRNSIPFIDLHLKGLAL